ncbi:hypothetical protein D3C80_1466450 [compost metagenome]
MERQFQQVPELFGRRVAGVAQLEDDVFGGPGTPIAEDALEQFVATLEVVVEAAAGDVQLFRQGVDPHRVDATLDQHALSGVDPVFAGKRGACRHVRASSGGGRPVRRENSWQA